MSARPDLLRVRCPQCNATGTARWSDESSTYVVDLDHADALCPYVSMPEALDTAPTTPRNDG